MLNFEKSYLIFEMSVKFLGRMSSILDGEGMLWRVISKHMYEKVELWEWIICSDCGVWKHATPPQIVHSQI